MTNSFQLSICQVRQLQKPTDTQTSNSPYIIHSIIVPLICVTFSINNLIIGQQESLYILDNYVRTCQEASLALSQLFWDFDLDIINWHILHRHKC